MGNGIEFFSFDVDFFNDDKVALIEAEFGQKGSYVAVRLLCKIYSEGYYYKWGEDECLLFSKKMGAGFVPSLITEIVNGLIRRGFFDKTVFDSFGILTSAGIQKRYFEATKRRQNVIVDKRYLLTDVSKFQNVYISNENVYIEGENVDISKQSKVKYSKVKESKENTPPLTPPDGVEENDGGGGKILISDLKKSLSSVTSLTNSDIWEGMRLSLNGNLNSYGGSVIKYWLEHQDSNPYYIVIQSLQSLEQQGKLRPKPMAHEDYFAYIYVYEKCLRTDAEKIKAMVSDPMCLSELKKLIIECKKGRIKTPGAFILSRLKQLKTPARQANQIAS